MNPRLNSQPRRTSPAMRPDPIRSHCRLPGRFRPLLTLTAGVFLAATGAEASHFRGASLTWKRLPTPANPANTIEASATESWRSDSVGSNSYNWGDNTFFTTAGAPVIATGTGFSVIRRVVNHTYASEGPWTISTSGCCRVSNLSNAADQNWFLSSVVDLRGGNQGSPVITSPVVLQMIRGGLNSVPLAFVDVDGDPVTFRMATAAESGIPTVAQAGGKVLAVSPSGVLSWDTSATTVGQLYAAQVIARDNHPFPGGAGTSSVQFDFVIQIVDGTLNRPPVATGNSGPFIATIGQPFSNVIVGTDPDGGNLTVTHQGLPPGATLTPVSGTTGPQPLSATFNWTPTLAQADSSFGITLVFTDPGGLQTSKSFAITVPSNQPPVVNAGPDQTVFDTDSNGQPTTVGLNGLGSYDPENAPLTYAWTQIGGTRAVTLVNPNSATPSFLAPSLHVHPDGAPEPLVLQFRLVVSDGKSTRSDDVSITVKHHNEAPLASASGPASAPEATLVVLDASASSDPDFDPLSYTWTQTSGPAVTLAPNGTNQPVAGFSHVVNAPHSIPGELLGFTVTVSDGIDSATSTVVPVFIRNVNQPPVSDAGDAEPVFDDDSSVTLDGYGYDVDGDGVSLHWTQVAGPPVVLDDPASEEPSFVPPPVSAAQGSVTLTFKLTVSDAIDANDPDALIAESTVDVLVKHSNRAPVAAAGPDQTVPELGLVTLDGSGCFDPDSDALDYQWEQTDGIPVILNTLDPLHPTFTAPDVTVSEATLTFKLVVSDGSLLSAASIVRVRVNYVNRPPVLGTISSQTLNEGSAVTLHAAATDPDGNALAYSWTQTGGTAVTLDLTDPSSPTFTAPPVSCDGDVLVFTVTVDDSYAGGSVSGSATVNVVNVNNPPVADAGPSQSVQEEVQVLLDGTFSTDPDLEALSYAWTQTGGAAVTLSDPHAAQPTFTAPRVNAGGNPNLKQVLTFSLAITDECGASSTDSVEITVTNVPHDPLADAGGSQSANEAALVTLDSSASSDPDGDALTHAWTQVSGPAVALSGANTTQPTFTAPFVGTGGASLVFKVTVQDGYGGKACDTVTISVLNTNTPPVVTASRASVASVWPPNHAMVPISILGVQDPDNNATIMITSVTQDEPTNGLGDGDTAIDAILQGSTALVRSERAGKGNGRVYHIHFTASDLEGSSSGMVTVGVPKDKKGDAAIDGGELNDSTR